MAADTIGPASLKQIELTRTLASADLLNEVVYCHKLNHWQLFGKHPPVLHRETILADQRHWTFEPTTLDRVRNSGDYITAARQPVGRQQIKRVVKPCHQQLPVLPRLPG